MRPRDSARLKPLHIIFVRVDLFANFPRNSRHRCGKFGARLMTRLADTAEHAIGRFRRTRHRTARLAGSHRTEPLKIADREPISQAYATHNARWPVIPFRRGDEGMNAPHGDGPKVPEFRSRASACTGGTLELWNFHSRSLVQVHVHAPARASACIGRYTYPCTNPRTPHLFTHRDCLRLRLASRVCDCEPVWFVNANAPRAYARRATHPPFAFANYVSPAQIKNATETA